jgi:cell division protein FtsQ
MDGRGRLAEPLKRPGNARPARGAGARVSAPPRPPNRRLPTRVTKIASRISSFVRFWMLRLDGVRIPRFTGMAALALFLVASIGYGAVRGDHVPMIVDTLKDWRDAGADSLGFRIAAVSLSGEKHVGRAEIIAAAGVTGRASLLFLDVEAARSRLKTIPWIADASVRKLFPDRLQIRVREREPFALWQVDGKLALIAADGTVIGPVVDPAFASLPLVVGRGAQAKARDFLALLDRYPSLREQVRASVLVAERRWNLKLKNNLDIRLPEADVGPALDTLVALDRAKRLISRDILAIDLRLPDRVTVRLSDAAAQAREEARKPPKKKGGDA